VVHVTSTLYARVAALAEAEPALADSIGLRGALILLLAHADLEVGELRLPADLVRARLSAGTPLIDRLDLPIPTTSARLVDRLAVALLADPSQYADAEALVTALRSHRLHGEQLVGEAVVGHQGHLDALASFAELPTTLVSTVADLAARAVLEGVAARLRPALSLGAWDRGYCPICGSRPVFGEQKNDGQAKIRLRCGRCATAWNLAGEGCPECPGGRMTIFDTPDQNEHDGWRLAHCDACTSYLKLAPALRSGSLADLLVDDLASWSLDRQAVERGLRRQDGIGYPLEHGDLLDGDDDLD
jgi:FdhE protein